jgi:hypothetical protein
VGGQYDIFFSYTRADKEAVKPLLVLQLSFPLRLNNCHSFCTRSVQIRLGKTHQSAVHEMGWCTPTYT